MNISAPIYLMSMELSIKEVRDTYQMFINEDDADDSGVYCTAFTTNPAIELLGVALSDHKEPVKLSFASEEQIIYAPLLVPNKPIYRYDAKLDYEYDILFTTEQIRKARNKFHRNPKALFSTNLEHTDALPDGAAYIVTSWIVKDTEKDLSQAIGLPKLEPGTWCVGYHIRDKALYNQLKDAKVGLSIEGFFNDVKLPSDALDRINKNKTNTKMNNESNMFSKLAKYLTKKFSKQVKMWDETLDDGRTITIDDTTFMATIDGQAAEDGDYTIQDGSVYTVQDGVCVQIQPSEEDRAEDKVERNAAQLSDATQPIDAAQPNDTTQPSDATQPVTIDELKKMYDELKKLYDELAAKINDNATVKASDIEALQKSNADLINERAELTKELEKEKQEVVTLSKLPATTPLNTSPLPANKPLDKMPVHERLAHIAARS